MSTIKVNKIENTSTTDGGISIDNSGHVTVDGQQLPSTGALSNRNLVVNGGMEVAQRAASKTGITTTGYYTVDRFKLVTEDEATYTMEQSTDAPAGFKNSLKFTVTTADSSIAADDYGACHCLLEGYDTVPLGLGASGAKSFTLSFYVKSSQTGTFGLNLFNRSNTRNFASSYTINAANTWERKTITIPGDTSGTWEKDLNAGLKIWWSFIVGSTYAASSVSTSWDTYGSNLKLGLNGQVQLSSTTNATWQITGVQLEVGSVATPFEHRSFNEELERCKRYFQKSYSYGIGVGANSNNGRYYWLLGTDTTARNKGGSIYLGHEMRVAPTLQVYNDAGTQGVIQFPASSATPLLLKTNVIAIYVANTTAAEIAGAWSADAEL